MLTLTELKSIFKEYGFTPLKRFGENYLIDRNIKDKIISASCVTPSDTILEIGPGLGALTIDLAESGAEVYAVEKDKKAFGILGALTAGRYPNLHIVNEDILKFDPGAIPAKNIKVLGNLPYYITTPAIEHIIENRKNMIFALVVVQKEVAERILSEPGSRNCGSISCFVRYYTDPEYLHTIKRSSFFPVPDVDSALLKLVVRRKPPVQVKDEKLLFKIIRGSFNQRRKSIINSLSREAVLGCAKPDLFAIFKRAGVSPAARPEDLTLAEFAAITNSVALSHIP